MSLKKRLTKCTTHKCGTRTVQRGKTKRKKKEKKHPEAYDLFLGTGNWRRTKTFISKIKMQTISPTMLKVFKYFATWGMQLAEGRSGTTKCQLSWGFKIFLFSAEAFGSKEVEAFRNEKGSMRSTDCFTIVFVLPTNCFYWKEIFHFKVEIKVLVY